MRKFITALMAVAMLAAIILPASASAAVERCQVTTTVSAPSVTTATFTALQPRNTTHQFSDVWRHEFAITVNTDGTFEGTGETFDNDGSTVIWAETITGSFNADKSAVSFKTIPVGGGATFKVIDAPYNVSVDVDDEGTWDANSIEMMISKPAFTTVPGAPTVTTTEYKNHGEYVSSLGGGKVNAQACAGMPLVSTQGTTSVLKK
jgi:hypothetical protein